MLKPLLAATCLLFAPTLSLAQTDVAGDSEKGERVFRKCQACHAVGEDAANKVGPQLNGIVGQPIAAVADFKYSDVLIQMGADGKVWTVEDLDAFLLKPRDFAKGTKMSFAGLRKEDERQNVIAYLATFPAEGS